MNDKSRTNSSTTAVGEGGELEDVEDWEHWRLSPVIDKVELRFSTSHASHMDNPYPKTPSRLSRIAPDRPLSQMEFQDYPANRLWRSGGPYRFAAPTQGKNPWQKCRKLADKYDDEMCAAWKEEIDKLLIFAGLFSATITAFTVESYKWLKEETDDQTAQLIAYLTAQLTKDAGPLPPSVALQPFSVSSSEVRINAVWFISLTLSLTTVLVGILCLQWLREYQRDGTLPHKDALALRQMRFDGLIYWRVPEIMSFLPLLLQISLVLFFLGLLDLLWARNQAVAACVTVAVGIVLLFIIITTVLPTMQHVITGNEHLQIAQCPYKSPQSWLYYRVSHALFFLITKTITAITLSGPDSPRFHRLLKSTADTSWLAFDMRWRRLRDATTIVRGSPKDLKDGEDLHDALHWLNINFAQNLDAVYPLHACLTSPRDLDIGSAEQAISQMYKDLELNMDAATFRVMLDDRYSPGEAQKRDIVKAFYLHLHLEVHRTFLWAEYVEAVVRILNTQDVPRPFYDWLSEILIELSGKVVVVSGASSTSASGKLRKRKKERNSGDAAGSEGKRLHLVGDDEEVVLVQVLMCVRGLIESDALRVLDMVMTWNLMYYLLYGFSDRPLLSAILSGAHLDANIEAAGVDTKERRYLALVLSILDALVGWLERGKEMDRWEKVKLCAEGVLKIFPPAILASSDAIQVDDDSEMGDVGGEDEDSGRHSMTSVINLITALDCHMMRMGGAPAVLDREKWWHEFWESKFSSEDWRALLYTINHSP